MLIPPFLYSPILSHNVVIILLLIIFVAEQEKHEEDKYEKDKHEKTSPKEEEEATCFVVSTNRRNVEFRTGRIYAIDQRSRR